MLNWTEDFRVCLKKLIFSKGRINGTSSDIFMVSFCHREGFTWTCWVDGQPELVTTLVNLGRTPERIFVAEEALLNHYISSISPGVSVYEIVKPHHEEWTFILVLELHGQKSEEGAFALCVCVSPSLFISYLFLLNILLIIFGLFFKHSI